LNACGIITDAVLKTYLHAVENGEEHVNAPQIMSIFWVRYQNINSIPSVMEHMKKKLITLCVVLGFCVVATIHAEGADKRTVTFAKCFPDGTVQTFTDTVVCREGKTMAEDIAEKCAVLVREDAILQEYTDTGVGLYFVISAGEGLHFALPPSLMQSTFLDIIFSLFPSVVYCNYNTGASTDIISLTSLGNETLLEGAHRVLCIGFVGILGWEGMFSYDATGFAGFTPFIWTAQS